MKNNRTKKNPEKSPTAGFSKGQAQDERLLRRMAREREIEIKIANARADAARKRSKYSSKKDLEADLDLVLSAFWRKQSARSREAVNDVERVLDTFNFFK